MSITRPITRSITRSITRGITTDIIQRYFTTLDPAFNQHFVMPVWTASGEFDIELDWQRADITQTNLLGQALSGSNRIAANNTASGSPDTVFIIINGSVRQWTGALSAVSYGKLVRLRIKRYANNTVELWVSGISAGVVSAITGDFSLDVLGQGNNAQYVSGVYANVSLDNFSGDQRLYKLDEDFGSTTVVANSEATLGSELYSFSGVGVSSEGAVAQTLTGFEYTGGVATSRSYINISTLPEVGLVALNTNAVVNIYFRDGLNGIGNVLGSLLLFSGSLDMVIPAGTQTVLFEGDGFTEYTIDNISIKAAHGYATAVNITGSELFTKYATYWRGQNTWIDPPSAIGTQWTDLGSGRYSYSGDGSYNVLQNSGILSADSLTEVSFNVETITGSMKVFSVPTIGLFNTTGDKSFTVVPGGEFLAFTREAGIATCTIGSIETRRILEVA